MSDSEYREFLEFLFQRHIRPRTSLVGHKLRPHFDDEFAYHLQRLERAARVLRFLEVPIYGDEGPYETLNPSVLERAMRDSADGLAFSKRIAEDGGYLDLLDDHLLEIAEGLDVRHLPVEDAEVLRMLGSENAEAELRMIVRVAKRVLEKRGRDRNSNEGSIRQELDHALDRIRETQDELARWREKENVSDQRPKKKRRWFKGLGQIGQGSAMTIANVALASGVLKLPPSTGDQTVGAIASVTAGVGFVLAGIGDLRNE